jgi:hypothetical protein
MKYEILDARKVRSDDEWNYAVLLNPLEKDNKLNRVVMVSLRVVKGIDDKFALNQCVIKGTVSDEERDSIRRGLEFRCQGPVKVTMSI